MSFKICLIRAGLFLFFRQGQPPRSNDTPVVISFLSTSATGFPSFQASQRTFVVSQDVAIGSTITTVSASSPRGSTIPLTFSIAGGNIDLSFEVDGQGQVKVRRSLDYRKVKGYALWVEVRDGSSDSPSASPPLTSHMMLAIGLTKTNRNGPEFDEAFYRATVQDQQVAGVDVIVVHAVDGDLEDGEEDGGGGGVTYSLDKEKNNDVHLRLFSVDPSSGLIQTKYVLNSSIYWLVVLATDHVRFGLQFTS